MPEVSAETEKSGNTEPASERHSVRKLSAKIGWANDSAVDVFEMQKDIFDGDDGSVLSTEKAASELSVVEVVGVDGIDAACGDVIGNFEKNGGAEIGIFGGTMSVGASRFCCRNLRYRSCAVG